MNPFALPSFQVQLQLLRYIELICIKDITLYALLLYEREMGVERLGW